MRTTRNIALQTTLDILPVIGSRRLSQSSCSSFCICLFTDRVHVDYLLTLMHKLRVSSARIAFVCHSFNLPPHFCPVLPIFPSLSRTPRALFILPPSQAPSRLYNACFCCTVSPSLVQPSDPHLTSTSPKMMFLISISHEHLLLLIRPE